METATSNNPQAKSWRGSSGFIFTICVIGITTEAFVYGVVVPLLPFILRRFPWIIEDPSKVQIAVSVLLSSGAFVGVILSPILGLVLDRYSARKLPFVFGLLLLMVVSAGVKELVGSAEGCSRYQYFSTPTLS
jgi:MFS family permease